MCEKPAARPAGPTYGTDRAMNGRRSPIRRQGFGKRGPQSMLVVPRRSVSFSGEAFLPLRGYLL
jgi:hypothetical protein